VHLQKFHKPKLMMNFKLKSKKIKTKSNKMKIPNKSATNSPIRKVKLFYPQFRIIIFRQIKHNQINLQIKRKNIRIHQKMNKIHHIHRANPILWLIKIISLIPNTNLSNLKAQFLPLRFNCVFNKP
jgi:hypothetical protein